MSYTAEELKSIYNNQSEYTDYNNFILNFDEDEYAAKEIDPTDPKKAKGDA